MREVLLAGMIFVAGCGLFKAETRVQTMEDIRQSLITGCAIAPIATVSTEAVLTKLQPGTTIDDIRHGMAVAEPWVTQLCALVNSPAP